MSGQAPLWVGIVLVTAGPATLAALVWNWWATFTNRH
jgi:hypothetical protein